MMSGQQETKKSGQGDGRKMKCVSWEPHEETISKKSSTGLNSVDWLRKIRTETTVVLN